MKSISLSFGIIMYEMLMQHSISVSFVNNQHLVGCYGAHLLMIDDEIVKLSQDLELFLFAVKNGWRPTLPNINQLQMMSTSSTEIESLKKYIWLIEMCWHQDPDKRPTFNQIVK